ncbi:hypothetical protein PMZ80_005105 [Knufia obscura]|uniref:Enoyl-CoA hydratase n=2 Tax=Knufia TaxID=430999 RepID=A0AAN8I764_9EURO|nr:hypothetical protein PMZ80_005105 [Knufia obscura]KAK5957767.1 hypothetical protein OHC33_000956 [Knufia fluminis]
MGEEVELKAPSEDEIDDLAILDELNQAEPSTHRERGPKRLRGKFPDDLPGTYTTRSYAYRPALALVSHEETSYDDVLERILRFLKALRTKTTDIFGLDVAKGVTVLRHNIAGDQANGYCLQVEFSNPKKGNALNAELMRNLATTFRAIATIRSVNGIVLKAGGGAFCGGADVREMAELKTAEQASTFIKHVTDLCTAIRDCPVPVIAAIDGPCIGAGLEMAASCDMRVGSSLATFSMPEVLLGIPSVVEARLLCDIVGWGRARHLMLTGCSWSATEAYEAGLITRKFDESKDMFYWVGDTLLEWNNAAQVHRVQKALMRKWETSSVDEGIAAGVEAFASRFASPKTERKVKDLMELRMRKVKEPHDHGNEKRLDLGTTRRGSRRLVLESDGRDEQKSDSEE